MTFSYSDSFVAQRDGYLSCQWSKCSGRCVIFVVLRTFSFSVHCLVLFQYAKMWSSEFQIFVDINFLHGTYYCGARRASGHCRCGKGAVVRLYCGLVFQVVLTSLFANFTRPTFSLLVFTSDFVRFFIIGVQPGNVAGVGFQVDALPWRVITWPSFSPHTSRRVQVERRIY